MIQNIYRFGTGTIYMRIINKLNNLIATTNTSTFTAQPSVANSIITIPYNAYILGHVVSTAIPSWVTNGTYDLLFYTDAACTTAAEPGGMQVAWNKSLGRFLPQKEVLIW